MGAVKNAAAFGFGASLGSYGALALPGLLAGLGILLIWLGKPNKTKGKNRNMVLTVLGIILIVLVSLPYLPIIGISMLPDLLSSNS